MVVVILMRLWGVMLVVMFMVMLFDLFISRLGNVVGSIEGLVCWLL